MNSSRPSSAPTPAEGSVDRMVTGWMRLSYSMPSTREMAQYRAGTVSDLDVVSAQTSASESSLLAVRNRQLAAVNQLLKNVAGRWAPQPAATPTT